MVAARTRATRRKLRSMHKQELERQHAGESRGDEDDARACGGQDSQRGAEHPRGKEGAEQSKRGRALHGAFVQAERDRDRQRRKEASPKRRGNLRLGVQPLRTSQKRRRQAGRAPAIAIGAPSWRNFLRGTCRQSDRSAPRVSGRRRVILSVIDYLLLNHCAVGHCAVGARRSLQCARCSAPGADRVRPTKSPQISAKHSTRNRRGLFA